MACIPFGDTVKQFRKEKRILLRYFCEELKIPAQYWSKVELNINPPPCDLLLLLKVAKVLQLTSDERSKLFKSSQQWVSKPDKDIASRLPAFYHGNIDDVNLDRLIADIKSLTTQDA